MRSALIVASLALSILAAPVPVAEPVPALQEYENSAAPVEALLAKRYQRTTDGGLVGSRSIAFDDLEKRGGRGKAQGRSVDDEEDEEELEKRGGRGKAQGRSVDDDEEELEKRGGRGKAQGRSVDDDEEELEKRGGRGKAQGRSVEKRGGRGKAQGRSVDDEEELEKRGGRGKAQGKRDGEQSKNTVRNIYDGVVGIVEALKTRGFSSANNFPVRQPM